MVLALGASARECARVGFSVITDAEGAAGERAGHAGKRRPRVAKRFPPVLWRFYSAGERDLEERLKVPLSLSLFSPGKKAAGLVRLEPRRMEGRVWREGWSRGEAPISSLAGRAISPTPGNGHVQPHWRRLAWSPGTTALAGA